MFNVFYIDDNKRKHYCIAKNFAELQFIINRFIEVEYEPIPSAS